MLKKTIGFACVAACLGTFGEPTMGEADGKYVIDVPTGETYALTARQSRTCRRPRPSLVRRTRPRSPQTHQT